MHGRLGGGISPPGSKWRQFASSPPYVVGPDVNNSAYLLITKAMCGVGFLSRLTQASSQSTAEFESAKALTRLFRVVTVLLYSLLYSLWSALQRVF